MFIENQLSDLIRLNGRAVVPGVGQFNLVYKPAVIDYIHKNVTPPGKFVGFVGDETLQIADIPDEQCAEIEKSLWESEGTKWQQRLNNKETILLPNLGSIYKDFRGDINFIASEINYDDSSYGLRKLNIEPVIRKTESVKATPSIVNTTPASKPKSTFHFADTLFSVLIGLTLIAISFGVWFAMSSKQELRPTSRFPIAESTLEDAHRMEEILDYDAPWSVPGYYGDSSETDSAFVDEMIPPSAAIASPEEIEPEPAKEIPVTESKPVVKPKNIPQKSTAVVSGNNSCQISVGAFSSKANAKALSKKLSGKGFASEIKEIKGGSISRVVVKAPCDDASLNELLEKLRIDFNPDAFIVQ